MARESQGLQIALIVFVMFTIILGVTTFLFSKEYGKTKALAAEKQKAAEEASAAQKAAEQENMRLKQVVGHSDTATLSEVDEAFNTDIQTYAKNLNETNLSYRAICQSMFKEVTDKNAELAAAKKQIVDIQLANQNLEKAKEAQLQQFLARAKKAEDDLAAEKAKYLADRGQLTQTVQQVEGQKTTERQQAQAAIAKVDAEKKDLASDNHTLKMTNSVLRDRLEEQTKEIIQPDGKITFVNQSQGTVWIDIGRAAGLSLLTNFAVYSADTNDLTTAATKKGAIEVVALVGDNMAEARILEDVISDPIMPGDRIHTNLWKPGERQRFALTDGIDLDGDKRSDIDEVRNLIAMNGGIVDFWLTDDGKPNGQLSAGTRFLVLGKEPETADLDRLNARTKVIEEAKMYGLKIISLTDLLNGMGYVRTTPVVRYGAQANPIDFRAKPPEGVPRVSSGTVSDLFQKRNPPTPAARSAY